jgi:hypothetical protein
LPLEEIALYGTEGAHGEWVPETRARRRFCREAGTQDGDPDLGEP